MIGPLLLQTGNEEQKREHLPRIVRGEIRWCQGYSEPGAGSDLAGLQTRAVRDGDDYVLNGQKVWTSYGDKSDWMFILVRTDTTQKQGGITFLLMDMDAPGVQVRPIKLISGASPFCETFITDVRVPRRNVVGQENGGWNIAKMLLRFERNMIADAFKVRDDRSRLLRMARHYLPCADDGRLARRGAARPPHPGRARSAGARPHAVAVARSPEGGAAAGSGGVDLQALRHRAEPAPPRADGGDRGSRRASAGRDRGSATTSWR